MHIITGIRGIKHEVDRAITELQGKKLPWKFQGQDSLIDLAVRPIQLYEFVFPKEHLQTVMRSLFISLTNPEGKINWNPKHTKYLKIMQKAMGAKPFPELEKNGVTIPFNRNNIEFFGIGIKEDGYETL